MKYISGYILSFLFIALNIHCAIQKPTTIPSGIPAPKNPDIKKTIMHLDSTLFDAFNSRNLEKLSEYFSHDLELYHDIEGVSNYQQTMDEFNRLFQKDYILTRTLVAGSMEIFPIRNFGAIQSGKHTLCE